MEAKLIVEEGPSKGIAFLLDKDSQYYIGRDPDFCTFIVEDPKASRKHALIIKEGKSVSIENLSKTNPLLLNDLLIESKTLLQEGDKIKIGSNVIIFTFDEFKEESNYKEDVFTDFDRDERDKNPSATIYEEILDDKESEFNEAIVDLKIRERFLLKIISGPQVGAEFSITPSKKFIIGSDPLLADIILYDLSVSKKHASITIQEDTTCLIEDLQSRNGIFINGSKIENQARVKPQDVILLGTTSFVLIDTEEESRTIIATGPSIIKEDIDIKEKTAEIKE
jgi:pSer/pThr/pTyr-binding forkhead associated (FHA) protein